MARVTKGKHKLSRRERFDLYPRLGEQNQTSKRLVRKTPPGEHQMFSRQSQYARQLREKQKVKRSYGLLERQFRRFYSIASRKKEQTGLALLQLLETRIDNIAFRGGLALTRSQARQLVNHGHIKLNEKRNSIPSTILEIGDVLSLDQKISKLEWYKSFKQNTETYVLPNWLERVDELSVKLIQLPTRDELEPLFNEQLIVELYSK